MDADKILALSSKELEQMSVKEIVGLGGGLNYGHTEFLNGWHGDGWVEKGFVIRYPNLLDEVTRRQAKRVEEVFGDVDLVVGAAQNGAIVASYVARHLRKRFAFTVGKGEEMAFHRMYRPDRGMRVCLVDDLFFSGTDARDHIDFFRKEGLNLRGMSVWISRQGQEIGEIRVATLMPPVFTEYEKEECPLCAGGEEVLFKGVRE